MRASTKDRIPAPALGERQAELRRQYRLLSTGNRILTYSCSEHELLTDTCRALANIGGYRFAWIGCFDLDAASFPAPTTLAAWGDGALAPSHSDARRLCGEQTPSSRAMRERKPQIVRAIDDERWSAAWRAQARKRGHAAALSMPLLTDGRCLGVLELYTDSCAGFETSEVALLSELAEDLAFGIVTLRTRGAAEFLMHYDSLTGLAKRALFCRRLDQTQRTNIDPERLALENKLREAIDEQQFEIFYQPQVNLATGCIESVEALLRWNDPEHGLVMPASFLPVLESSGLIIPVGQWVVKRVMQDCDRWRNLGCSPVRAAVNVSAVQFRGRAFIDFVLDLVKDRPHDQGCFGLDLEITETALLQDMDGAGRQLRELRAAGIRIALDDFGTGYSSLGLLSKLPVDLLKIDRSFIHGLPGDRACMTLTRTIVNLASEFGLLTVAEGVESFEQFELLRTLGCDQSQGFFHCRPVPAQEMDKLLARVRAPARAPSVAVEDSGQ